MRKRVTADNVQMIAIQQAKNNAMNTAEDSVSPIRPGQVTLQKGQTSHSIGQQPRIESAKRINNKGEDGVKLIKVQPNGAKTVKGVGPQIKNRTRP